MSKKEDAAYQKWLEDTRAKFPSELQTAFDSITGADAGKEIFRGHLRESDYYTKLNELNEEKGKIKARAEEQQEWYNTYETRVKPRIAEAERLKAKLRAMEDKVSDLGLDPESLLSGVNDKPASRGSGSAESTESQMTELNLLREKVEFFDKALPRVLGDMYSIVQKNLKDGFDVEPQKVIAFASENGVDPITAYNELTREERETRFQKSQEVALAKAREEGAREALSKIQGPDRIRPTGPSIVDSLLNKEQPSSDHRGRVDDAVKAFLEMQS